MSARADARADRRWAKKRFEIRGDKVRATYGHSFPVDLGGSLAEPPAELYFAAARDLAKSMLHRGLEPRDRQYVHLSVTAEEAESVARRHDPAPSVLVIDAQAAYSEGVRFYESGPLFLAEQRAREVFVVALAVSPSIGCQAMRANPHG